MALLGFSLNEWLEALNTGGLSFIMGSKKHGHEKAHAHCEHCLHFCGHCDVAYCCDCKREWGTHSNWYPHQWWTTTTPYVNDTITAASGTGDATTAVVDMSCSHSHN